MGRFSLAVVVCLAVAASAGASEAERQFKLGRRAEKAGRDVEAFLHYQRARAEAPSNSRFIDAAARLRGLSIAFLNAVAAPAEAPQADVDLSALIASLGDELDPAADLQEPVRLDYDDVVTSFRFTGSIQEAYERAAERFGVRVMFDDEFRGSRRIRFHLDDVDFPNTVIALNDIAQAIVVPITEKLMLIAADSPNKRTELDPVMAMNVPLPDAMTPEEANEVTQAVKGALDINRLFVSASRQYVTVRDTTGKVRIARALLTHLLQPRAEVVIQVDLISYNRDRQVELGVTLPTAFPVTNFSTVLNAQPPEAGAAPLLGIGGGETVFGVGIADAGAVATLERGEGNSRQSTQLRAVSGTQASIKIGERFPIANSQYSSAVITDDIRDQLDAGTLRPPIPSITFEDLGLSLTMTPTVHSSREVTLQIEAEFKLLAGGAVNGIPILANRSLQSQVRLDEGQAALIAGMGIAERRSNAAGPAGLAEIPILGALFRRKTDRMNVSDLLVVVTPHVVRLPPSETSRELAIRFGPEERPVPQF